MSTLPLLGRGGQSKWGDETGQTVQTALACRSGGSSSLMYVNSIMASPAQKFVPYILSGYTNFMLLAVGGC